MGPPLRRINVRMGVRLTGHLLEFYGTCAECTR